MMARKKKKILPRCYAGCLLLAAPLCKALSCLLRKNDLQQGPKRIVLLISRPLDLELLIGLHEKARDEEQVSISFWVIESCIKRHPGFLDELRSRNIRVGRIVNSAGLAPALLEFMRTQAFLTTVESSTARHKLPYLLTRLANAAGLATFTMQHGFENVGLTYIDDVHGPDVKFAAKTILTWGPKEELPAWVGTDTREKCIAVGCTKIFIVPRNIAAVKSGERPIIGVFDNLHWQRYSEEYVATFLSHLEEAASRRPDLRFILKSHPESVRTRSRELATRLVGMKNVDIADLLEENHPALTTPWLLEHALGVITTPSTIALDGALANAPVAVTRYGLELDYYQPLMLLDNSDDWAGFLDNLSEKPGYLRMQLNGNRFLKKVLVPGDPAGKILGLMAR